jgi:hypothetical protein
MRSIHSLHPTRGGIRLNVGSRYSRRGRVNLFVRRPEGVGVETSWWLDWGALPDRLIWARLQVADDGSSVVLDMDGVYHRFPDRQTARLWLNEDEYSLLTHLAEYGEVGPDVFPPVAASDRELVPLMCAARRHGAAKSNTS